MLSTFKTFTLSFDVMIFQTISKLKNTKSIHEYISKYVQIYRSYISPNQNIYSQTKISKSPNQNICSQGYYISDIKFADIVTLNDTERRNAAICVSQRWSGSRSGFLPEFGF